MSFLRKRKKRFEYGNCPPHKRHAMDQVPLEYGKQAKKNKFGCKWKNNFCRRWKISLQAKTNNKSKSAYERIHQVMNFHYYAIYVLGKETHLPVKNHHNCSSDEDQKIGHAIPPKPVFVNTTNNFSFTGEKEVFRPDISKVQVFLVFKI